MAVSLLGSATNAATSLALPITPLAAAVGAGELLFVVAAATGSQTPSSPSDTNNAAAAYALSLAANSTAGLIRSRAFHSAHSGSFPRVALATADTITGNWPSTSGVKQVVALKVKGVTVAAGGVVDTSAASTVAARTSVSQDVTTTAPGVIFMWVVLDATPGAISYPTDWVIDYDAIFPGLGSRLVVAHKIVAAAGIYNFALSWASSVSSSFAYVAFRK